MSNTNIANMNDKQLRNEVQLLRDELAIFKRKYEDLLYNLDDDNFSSRFVKEKGDMKTAIEITAEGLSSKVSKEEVQSEIKQAADEIKLSVTDLGQEVTSLTASTNGIESKVTNIEGGKFKGYTLFKQTGSKFSFTGNVEISGNAVVGGTIKGSSFQDSGGTTKLCLGYDGVSSVGDLNLIRINSAGTETNIFTVYDNFTRVDLKVFGDSFLYSTGEKTYPLGAWDFSYCDTDISGGGVAKFG